MTFSVIFLLLEQVSFISIQAPSELYAYHYHSRWDCSIYRLIITPLLLTPYIDRLMQGRRNSIANAPELRLPCINPSILWHNKTVLILALLVSFLNIQFVNCPSRMTRICLSNSHHSDCCSPGRAPGDITALT